MISESPCGPLLFRLPVVGPGGLIQLSLAKCATEPYAENPRIVNASTRTASIIILTSFCSIFFHRYSGVRPVVVQVASGGAGRIDPAIFGEVRHRAVRGESQDRER